jgi:hypothetical protein
MQKRFVVLLASFLLTAAQRTMGLTRPFLADHAGDSESHVRTGLLLRLSPKLPYAAEFNGSFPYVHLHHIPASVSYVPQLFTDETTGLTDASDLTVISLSDPQQPGIFGDIQSQAIPSVCPIQCCCLSCEDCGGCSSCTSTGCGGGPA